MEIIPPSFTGDPNSARSSEEGFRHMFYCFNGALLYERCGLRNLLDFRPVFRCAPPSRSQSRSRQPSPQRMRLAHRTVDRFCARFLAPIHRTSSVSAINRRGFFLSPFSALRSVNGVSPSTRKRPRGSRRTAPHTRHVRATSFPVVAP